MIAGVAALVGAAPDVQDLDGMDWDWDAGCIIEVLKPEAPSKKKPS